MDVDNLLPGERFDLRLKEALAGTDVFLAVIGARWLALLEARAATGERDYVREEIAAALAAKLVVIPVLMDRAALPRAASLPEDIRELALYHKHDVVYESFGRDVQALVAAINAHHEARETREAEAARLEREKEQAEIEVSAACAAEGEGTGRGRTPSAGKASGGGHPFGARARESGSRGGTPRRAEGRGEGRGPAQRTAARNAGEAASGTGLSVGTFGRRGGSGYNNPSSRPAVAIPARATG